MFSKLFQFNTVLQFFLKFHKKKNAINLLNKPIKIIPLQLKEYSLRTFSEKFSINLCDCVFVMCMLLFHIPFIQRPCVVSLTVT